MQVFISWSGDTSKRIALALRDWLPDVIQDIQPWMSDEDLRKGTRWLDEIRKQLEQNYVGVICLASDNLDSKWIHWEAGALAKGLEQSRIFTYLFELGYTQVEYPLAQFNHSQATENDTYKMVKSISEVLPNKPITEARLRKAFDKFWPDLEARFDGIRKQVATTTPVPPQRTQMAIAQETLELIRSLIQREGQLEAWVQTILAKLMVPPTVTWDPKKGIVYSEFSSGAPSITDLVKAVSTPEQEGSPRPDEPIPAGQRFRATPTDTR